jgi:hypothetical protein
MKKHLLIVAILLATTSSVFAVEQTICFSQKAIRDTGVFLATLGDDATLYGGKCEGVTLPEMNKKGWKLVQVVTGLQSSFGMVFEKIGK